MIRSRYIAAVDGRGGSSDWLKKVVCRTAHEGGLARLAFDGPAVIFVDERSAPSGGGERAVIGAAFQRGEDPSPGTGEPTSENISRFVQEHWGDYVLFCGCPDKSTIRILRSPSGGLHAYYHRSTEGHIISSDASFLLRVAHIAPTLDSDFLRHELAFPHLLTARTGLAGLSEIRAGELLELDGSAERTRQVWNPWVFASRAREAVDVAGNAQLLSRTVRACASALAQRSDPIILELSGGLDSTIVAASISGCGSQVTGINLVTPTAEGDERRYARDAARSFALPLIEAEAEQSVDLTTPSPAGLPRPGLPGVLLGWERRFMALASGGEAPGFFGGTGGDNVFCSLGSAAPAADALRVHGLGRTFFRAINDVATVHGSTWMTVLGMAWRQSRRPRPNPIWPRTTTFVRDENVPKRPDPHPWLDEPEGALPGSRAHIRSILAAYSHLDGYVRHQTAPSVFPLLAQPVVELALTIPSWIWIDGGRDRAVARLGFADVLPPSIAKRRTKGMMNAFCAAIYEANRARLAPFLLDGVLAGLGLLDCQALQSFLARPDASDSLSFYRVLALADVERWARSWS